jgi:hypothetical protein
MNTQFKTITHLKLNWLKNASENGGAMKIVIDSKPTENNVIWSQTKKNGKMWADVSNSQLLKILEKDNSIYEVIHKFPHKVYFDIDADNKDYDIYEKIVPKLNELFPTAEMAVSGSKSEIRQSYHIVLNNYLIKNEEERSFMKSLVKYFKQTIDDGFDDKVYTKNRFMKCINQSKEDGRIQAIILNDNPKKHLITTFINETVLDMPNFAITQPEVNLAIKIEDAQTKKFNVGDLPKLKLELPENIKFNINNFTPIEALTILPISKLFDHKYTHLIARYCFYNELTFENFYSWYKNKNDKPDAYTKWKFHWNHLNKFPTVDNNKIMTLIMKYYPSIKKDKHFANFQNLFKLSNILKVDKLTQDLFYMNSKFLCINTGMGSGKTYQTIKYLKDKENFIWITPNIALAQNTTQRLKTDGIDISYYKDFKKVSDKVANISKQDKLMICINSLHYTNDKNYKIVVIDEIESVLNKWFNNATLETNKLMNWERFLDIIRNADKVIFLDAFTSKLTIDFIDSISDVENIINYDIVELKESNVNRNIYFKSTFESWCGSIINSLKENKKTFIFYPFKDGCKDYISMENLKTIIEKNTDKKGICYNGDSDDKILKTLDDVNTHWNDADFVMTNNKINVGINYEKFDFDSVYLSIAGFSSPRDIIQVSYRCRHIKSNNIYVSYLNTSSTNLIFKNDSNLVGNCPIYNQLVNNILIEKKSPLKTTFNYFCNLAGYKIKYSKELINKDIDATIKALFDDVDLGYTYNTIKNINSEELDILEQKVYSMEATLDDKIAIKKYYYKKQFSINAPLTDIQSGWDERYLFFFKRVKELIIEPNNIYNKIKIFNNWDSILPSDIQINKAKLNNELIEQIFNEYYFKDLTKKSYHNNIIKNIYNNFFGKHIVKSFYDNQKHCKLYIDDTTRDMYELGSTYLKVYIKPASIIDTTINSELDAGIFLD